MIFGLDSDSNVSNVDLYNINNSQVYRGLFLLNEQTKKNPLLILWLIFRSERLKTLQFWKKKCGILFYVQFWGCSLCESRRSLSGSTLLAFRTWEAYRKGFYTIMQNVSHTKYKNIYCVGNVKYVLWYKPRNINCLLHINLFVYFCWVIFKSCLENIRACASLYACAEGTTHPLPGCKSVNGCCENIAHC